MGRSIDREWDMVAEPTPLDERTIDVESVEGSVADFLERVSRIDSGVVVRRNGMPLVVIAPVAPPREIDAPAAWERDAALLGGVGAEFAAVPLDALERRVAEAVGNAHRRRRERGELPWGCSAMINCAESDPSSRRVRGIS